MGKETKIRKHLYLLILWKGGAGQKKIGRNWWVEVERESGLMAGWLVDGVM